MALEGLGARPSAGRSIPPAMSDYRPEKCMTFARGWIEARSYVWQGREDEWRADEGVYYFNLALSPRVTAATMGYLGPGRCPPQQTGRAILIPPGQSVCVDAPRSRQRTFDCALDAGLIEEVVGRAPEWDRKLLTETMRLGAEVEWLLLKMYQELRRGAFGASIMVEGFANALAVEVVRRLALERRGPRRGGGGLAPWRMRILRDRIHADGPTPTLSELAELCGMSVRHLCRAFKTETGETIGKAVEAAMLERASTLLSGRNASVGDVARALGFADSASFAYAFRRATGLRPSDIGARISEGR